MSLVTLPRYSVPAILKLRDRLCQRLIPRYSPLALGGSEVELFADELAALLPKSVLLPALMDTVRQLIGTELTPEFLRDFSWRLAGNLASLKEGRTVVPWRSPGIEEWVPMQVLRVDPAPDYRGKGGRHTLRLRILAGSACPLLISKTFSKESLVVASRHFGFSKYQGQHPYLAAQLMTSLRFYGLLDPAKSRRDLPGFFQIRCPPGCLEHNTEILRIRFRTHGKTCPRNYQHDCHQCAIGYETCPGGTHRKDLMERLCDTCGKIAWFDPELPPEKCIGCWRRSLAVRS